MGSLHSSAPTKALRAGEKQVGRGGARLVRTASDREAMEAPAKGGCSAAIS